MNSLPMRISDKNAGDGRKKYFPSAAAGAQYSTQHPHHILPGKAGTTSYRLTK